MEIKEKKTPEKKDNWEYKNRTYYLMGRHKPLTYTLPSKHSGRYPLVWFDPEKGYEREMRYASNQKSIFVDEQKGSVTLKHIVFEEGVLFVPMQKRNLQEFLEKHPHKNVIFQEYDKVEEAEDQYDAIELEIQALNLAYQMDIDQAEAILRVELGSNVSTMSSKELKRDLLVFAKRNSKLFLDLANDENVELRNFGIKAVEAKILDLAPDGRTIRWASNKKKLMTVPFEENTYSALAAWFKTDEGLEVYKSVQKKLK